MPPRRSRSLLAGIVLLLLVQFALRVHHPLALPAFVDEGSHIARARIIYHFDHNPVVTSHGKLLYYTWLGLFAPGESGALAVSRLATALFSLISAAALAAAARALFGRRAMIPALACCALLPFAVFYERMALADSFAGGLLALGGWQSVRLARRPTPRHGLIAGLVLGLAALAKLTTAPALVLPLAALLLLGGPAPPHAVERGKRGRRGVRVLLAVGIGAALPWLPVLIAAWWVKLVQGRDAILMDTYLLDALQTPAERLADFAQALRLLIGPLLLGLLAILTLRLLVRRTAPALWVLLWWAVIVLPNALLSGQFQARYLAAALPALAILFGGGMAALTLRPARLIAWGVFALWAITFALPFATTLTAHPERLDLPRRDIYNYFRGPYNGWGVVPGLDFLAARAERPAREIPVAILMRNCSVVGLHLAPPFAGLCSEATARASDPALWDELFRAAPSGPAVYVITEALPPDDPPADGRAWALLTQYRRPHSSGTIITVWQVRRG